MLVVMRRVIVQALRAAVNSCLRPLAFWKQAYRLGPDKPLRQNEKPVERGAGPRGHDIDGCAGAAVDSALADRHRRPGDPCRLAQKRRLAHIGLDQLDPRHAEDRQHQTGKPGAAAEIDQASRSGRDQRQELRRIENMPAPQIVERARGRPG